MKTKLIGWVFIVAAMFYGLTPGQSQTPPSGATAAAISQLDWLSGYWSAREGKASSEEFWLPASGQMMLGLHRDIFSSGTTFFEFLRIAETDAGLSYFASPKGRPAIEFKAIRLDSASATFENPDHDFPQRIIYTLDSDTTLLMRIEGMSQGEVKSSEWRLYKNNLPLKR